MSTHLIPSQVISVLVQQAGDLLHVDGVIEGCGIADLTLVGRDFALQALD